jgi:hypothetical protein
VSRADHVKRAKEFGRSAYRDDVTAGEYDRRLADLIAAVRLETLQAARETCLREAAGFTSCGEGLHAAGCESCAKAIADTIRLEVEA